MTDRKPVAGFGSVNTNMRAKGVKVRGGDLNADLGEPSEGHLYSLRLNTTVSDNSTAADEGHIGLSFSIMSRNIEEMVEFGRAVTEAIALMLVSEYPDPDSHIDALTFDLPNALTEAFPGVAFVPVESEGIQRDDIIIDGSGDVAIVRAGPDGDGDYRVYGAFGALNGTEWTVNHGEIHDSACADYAIESAWRQVPESAEALS